MRVLAHIMRSASNEFHRGKGRILQCFRLSLLRRSRQPCFGRHWFFSLKPEVSQHISEGRHTQRCNFLLTRSQVRICFEPSIRTKKDLKNQQTQSLFSVSGIHNKQWFNLFIHGTYHQVGADRFQLTSLTGYLNWAECAICPNKA